MIADEIYVKLHISNRAVQEEENWPGFHIHTVWVWVLDFTKMRTHLNFKSIFLKIVHQEGLYDAFKENPNFPTCHQILHIYKQWLLRCQSPPLPRPLPPPPSGNMHIVKLVKWRISMCTCNNSHTINLHNKTHLYHKHEMALINKTV